MKKSKLITSLVGGSVLLAAAPVVATSCSEDTNKSSNSNYLVCGNETIKLKDNLNQADINGFITTDYTFSDGVSHKAVFVNGEYVIATKITELCIGSTEDVVTINYGFLANFDHLQKLDLHGMKVFDVATLTLPNSKDSLTSFVVPTMVKQGTAVLAIPNMFLMGFTALNKIDLTGFAEVEVIRYNFLRDCSGLKSIDLTPMTKVIEITQYFLAGCTSLTSLDFSSFKLTDTIGDHFLYGCTSLEKVDLSGFVSVNWIDTNFLEGCLSLTDVDMSKMIGMTTASAELQQTGMLSGCKSLKAINVGNISTSTFQGTYSDDPFCVKLTEDEWNEYDGIDLVYDDNVATGWESVITTSGELNEINWVDEDTYCRKWANLHKA